MDTVKITSVHIYPVKSLKGIAVDNHQLLPTGLAFDRYWMVVMPNGRFVTQRQIPKMATITTALTDKHLLLSTEQHGSVQIPKENNSNNNTCSVTITRDKCQAIEESAEISAWLTDVLESSTPLRLVRLKNNCPRPQAYPELLGNSTTTYFADAAPYLIINQASLDSLNQTLLTNNLSPVDSRRFRPNIVITGLPAFTEHQVTHLSHPQGRYRFKHCYPCKRCIVTTIDQDLGTKDTNMQPLNTLITLNKMPDNPLLPALGENAILETGAGRPIAVGDSLSVTL